MNTKTNITRRTKAKITKCKVVLYGDEGNDGDEGCEGGVLVICSVLWLEVKSGCGLRVDDVYD